MSNMKDLALQLDQDFERLNDTSMGWSIFTWADQVEDGRFDGYIDWNHSYIYWFESYAHVILARTILETLGAGFSVLYDNAMERYAITSEYATLCWRD